jgi:hypothetical protein
MKTGVRTKGHTELREYSYFRYVKDTYVTESKYVWNGGEEYCISKS